MATNQGQSKGRGWHGDPQGHAKAGKKGGSRRAANSDMEQSTEQ